MFSLLRLFTDVKTKILLVKSETLILERCFLRIKSGWHPEPVLAEAIVWNAGGQIWF